MLEDIALVPHVILKKKKFVPVSSLVLHRVHIGRSHDLKVMTWARMNMAGCESLID